MGHLQCEWVKCYQNFYPIFVNPFTGQTCRRIIACDVANDEESCTDVPLFGFVSIVLNAVGEIPQKAILGHE